MIETLRISFDKGKTKFEGMGVKDAEKEVFYAVFSVQGVPYFFDNIKKSKIEGFEWDVSESSVCHYPMPIIKNGRKYRCGFCGYKCENGGQMNQGLVCAALNQEPNLTLTWALCVADRKFKKTFADLMNKSMDRRGVGHD